MNPEPAKHGAFTSNEDMLTTLNSMAVTLAVVSSKLDQVYDSMNKHAEKQEEMEKELDAVKAKLYTMSGVIGIGVSVVTNWVTRQITG